MSGVTVGFKCNKCSYHWRRTFSDEELNQEEKILINFPKCGA